MPEPTVKIKSWEHLGLLAAVLLIGASYLFAYTPSEPFFNNDETRHVLTGVYFRDLFHDRPVSDLAGYTVRYYLQYPALGLLIWPPFFYALEGVAMSFFGTSVVVGRVLVGLFGLLACAYVYRFARLRYDAAQSLGAALCFGLAPSIFQLSHYVMLEIPTLALGLAATFHFWRYLESDKRRDLFIASVAAALAALTRFDAIYLLPLFVVFLAITRRWDILRRREVWAAIVLALILVTPVYAVTAKYVGWLHVKQAAEQFSDNSPPLLSWQRWTFYPRYLQVYLGWPLLVPAVLGFLVISFKKKNLPHSRTEAHRENQKSGSLCSSVSSVVKILFLERYSLRNARAVPFLALAGVVYLTFTLIRELDERHAVYWLPAWALFAAHGLWTLAAWLKQPRFYAPLLAVALALTLWVDVSWRTVKTRGYVRGYEEAAQYVAANTQKGPFCFFTGRLNGNFIYQLRRHDTARRLWTLRADKLLFNDLAALSASHQQVAADEKARLNTIYRYDPELLVVETPHPTNPFNDGNLQRAESERRIRETIAAHPERFLLEKEINVNSNYFAYRGVTLQIYRNLLRNPNPERNLQFENLNLRGALQTEVSE